ncbi:MAG: hypothetical protein H6641_16025 [Caldilineaceae bacterium]|nr:hypothetical protein [Caldilineaceae bacterium]
MDQTIQPVVTALAAGAAALTSGASPTVQEAYARLKAYLANRYASVSADVAQLESQPESRALRQQIIAQGLASSAAAADAELRQRAQALLDALSAAPATVTGVSLQDIEAAAIHLRQISAQGDGDVVGVEVRQAKVSGEIDISDVAAAHRPDATTAPTFQVNNHR